MKKFFALLLVALFGVAPLFADDADAVADVKLTIVKDLEAAAEGNFAGSLVFYAPDYLQTASDGATLNYEQLKWMTQALDGKHPVEFWLFLYSVKNNGAMPPREELPRMKRLARTPKYVKLYEETLPELIARQKAGAKQTLDTLRFVSVRVDGGKAVAVVEYDCKNENGGADRTAETFYLRKVNAKWLFFRSVIKDK